MTRENHYTSGSALVLYIAAANFAFHLLTANRFGIFRDELYYLACGEHLGWGYVDQPPLIALVAWIARHLFGDWLTGLRLFPALAGAATVWLSGKLAREFGGRPFAQAIAALSVAVVPVFIVIDHWLTMNAFEPLIWLACAWCVACAINRDQPRYFIWFGLLIGLGLENKYTTAFFAAAVAIGIVLTRARRFLVTREFWFGVALAAVIFAPNFIWLVRHHFPFLELMHNIRQTNRDVVRAPLPFVLDQINLLNPVLAPLWIAGLVWFLRTRFRALGITYLILLATFIVLRGKNYYLTPIYPILFAAGGLAFEELTTASWPRWRWTRPTYITLILVTTALLLPFSAPVLSPEATINYIQKLGLTPPRAENQPTGPLPQHFADEFGWEEMTRETARVFHSLPSEEQKRTAIFSNSYGAASAIDFFGPRYGLPKAICKHQSYWLWGPRDYDGSIMIVLHSDGSGDREHFVSVETAGRVEHPYSRRDEWFDIFLCRELKVPLQDAWPSMKKWD